MLRTFVVAGAVLASLTTSSMAADWYVIKDPTAGASTSDSLFDPCYVTDRRASTGEQELAGPFQTQRQGLEAMEGLAGCDTRPDN